MWPQYRKMEGGQRLYAIHSARRFTELQRLGARWLKYEVAVAVYPELLRVQEMLAKVPPYTDCSFSEWNAVEALVENGPKK